MTVNDEDVVIDYEIVDFWYTVPEPSVNMIDGGYGYDVLENRPLAFTLNRVQSVEPPKIMTKSPIIIAVANERKEEGEISFSDDENEEDSAPPHLAHSEPQIVTKSQSIDHEPISDYEEELEFQDNGPIDSTDGYQSEPTLNLKEFSIEKLIDMRVESSVPKKKVDAIQIPLEINHAFAQPSPAPTPTQTPIIEGEKTNALNKTPVLQLTEKDFKTPLAQLEESAREVRSCYTGVRKTLEENIGFRLGENNFRSFPLTEKDYLFQDHDILERIRELIGNRKLDQLEECVELNRKLNSHMKPKDLSLIRDIFMAKLDNDNEPDMKSILASLKKIDRIKALLKEKELDLAIENATVSKSILKLTGKSIVSRNVTDEDFTVAGDSLSSIMQGLDLVLLKLMK